ncbi:hypothetical protein [Polyangium aurulentum]|uniref:hypothetical protein n=1 Tax=Polyangium aurulentum TaxID=2567896 RepID=UPI00113F6C2F|nr:hypothetical protein [Polyangium aurulentum]UQA55111.1 hypothetical protein E8A73_027600 [Polyangium aurulentum]
MVEPILVPRRGLMMLALAAAHLVCVSLSALGVRPPGGSLPGRAIAWYAALSGADSNYGYFAPFVGTQLRLTFEVTDRVGRMTEEPFRPGDNREVALRIANLVAMFWSQDDGFRRALSASLAGKVLATRPEAESVAVRLDVFEMPTMEAYRQGDRPWWALYYRARFVPRAKLGAQKETVQ